MPNPICLSPLKFYDKLEKQERYKSYAYGHISPLVMPYNVIHPFQFVVPNSVKEIESVYICDANKNRRITGDITTSLRSLNLINVGNYKVLIYFGDSYLLPSVPHEGLYYLEINTDINSYFSEVFCFVRSTGEYLELEYSNPAGHFFLKNGVVAFPKGFIFKVLLCSELGKPDYTFEEESTKRLGYTFIESQVSKKIYKFNTILPEYICDSLRLVRLCSDKKITSKDESYDMISFEIDVEWQEQGDLASVKCEFEVDNILTNFGGIELTQIEDEKEFNNDFNNDFKK